VERGSRGGFRWPGAAALLVGLLAMAPAARAQHVEITPVGGFKLAGSVIDGYGSEIDLNGPSAGATVDIAIGRQLWLTLLFSRAWSEDTVEEAAGARRATFTVDTYHAGVHQEVWDGQVRPYFGATIGLTRYAAGTLDAEPEYLFGLSIGGGVKLFPVRWLGFRADARGMANFAGGSSALACGGGCVLFFAADVLWLAEATAGVTFAF
jgi:hypothetical protein